MDDSSEFFIQRQWERRYWILFLGLGQVISYALAFAAIANGLRLSGAGDEAGQRWITIAGGVFIAAIVMFAVLSMMLMRPRVKVNLADRTLHYIGFNADQVTFDEANGMRLKTSIGTGLRLYGNRADGRTKSRFVLSSLPGGIRKDEQQHPLAEVLPTVLGKLADEVVIVEPMSWFDAIKSALFLNVAKQWSAGRSTMSDSIVS